MSEENFIDWNAREEFSIIGPVSSIADEGDTGVGDGHYVEGSEEEIWSFNGFSRFIEF